MLQHNFWVSSAPCPTPLSKSKSNANKKDLAFQADAKLACFSDLYKQVRLLSSLWAGLGRGIIWKRWMSGLLDWLGMGVGREGEDKGEEKTGEEILHRGMYGWSSQDDVLQ